MDYHAFTKKCDGMCDSCECPPAKPVNGIAATMFHDEGAYAQCGNCGRYSLDRLALGPKGYMCDCGEGYAWSGSFKVPGPDATWAGKTPNAKGNRPA